MKTKKYIMLTSSLLSITLLLGACGTNKNEPKEDVPKGEVGDPTQDGTVSKPLIDGSLENEFGFRHFNLQIDTPENENSVIAQYNVYSSKAVYKNLNASSNLEGDPAYALLQPTFLELKLTKDMSSEEVIERVITAFDVNEYTNFNLEIEYKDGEKKIYSNNTK